MAELEAVILSVMSSRGGATSGQFERAPGVRRGLRANKVSHTLAQEILREVAARKLTRGDRLPPEAEMLVEYGVARSSLREALRILEVLGLIEIRTGPAGGPVVRDVTTSDFARTATFYLQANGLTMRELVDARIELEPFLAESAARKRDPELISLLNESNDLSLAHIDDDDARWAAASMQFHRVVSGFSGNRVLDFLAGALGEIYSVRLSSSVIPLDHREETHATHVAIAEAIAGGDAERTGHLMRLHMAEYARHIADRFPTVMDTVIDWG